ncbi:aminomethyltransferase family protein [Nesterenkonia muleiensis]|uniref:aminomethyltransferase family protein n=1 Tax=Nesterenkonia muleiensis TaxID=2282648 RepID=UPI000E75C712|nr:aminomethyltransferase family protein [Nesterenkonia muleiensis]
MSNAQSQKSLQQLTEEVPSLLGHFYNDAPSPHFSRSGNRGSFIPPAFTNWRDEQRSWSETAALFHQSHHMPEMFLEGPDALKLLEYLGINSLTNFTADRAKQYVVCAPKGHVIGDCIAYRLGEHKFELVSSMPLQNWVHYNAEVGNWDVEITRDAPSNLNPSGERTNWRFQIDGPNAGEIFSKVIDGDMPELRFFRTARVTIRGCDVLVLRHGMAGHQGVEISGPFGDEERVRNSILEVGRDYGLLPVGTQAYFSTPLSNGWMAYPVPGIFTDPELKSYREWLSADGWEAHTELGGSFVADSLEDYYATPYDLGYGHIIKYDHDFVGREALQNLPEESKRQKVSLVWNREDVEKVFRSQFGHGPRYKAIETPVSYYSWNHFDEVHTVSGSLAGVSCHAGYVNPIGEHLSLAMIAPEHAEPGTELEITWGEPDGGSRKPQVEDHVQTTIRAVVHPVPYDPKTRQAFRTSVGVATK